MGEEDKSIPAWKSFTAGGFGGTCLVIAGHPLDTLKVRLQTMPVPAPGAEPMYKGAIDCAMKTVRKEGPKGLYRGMLAPVIGVTPMYAVCFAGYNMGLQLQGQNDAQKASLLEHWNAGMLAGVFTTGIMVPGERIKCILQIQGTDGGPAKFKGPLDVAKHVVKESGVRGLYKGSIFTLLRDVPGSGAYFAGYEGIRRSMLKEGQTVADLNALQTLFAGGMAGICNWTVSIPADVLKSRFQTAPEGTYTGLADVFKKTVQAEGYGALYKGVGPIMARAFPANAACFLGYEFAMKLLNILSPP